eukprot:15354056-Ditylum_brightwellii.AAC.1
MNEFMTAVEKMIGMEGLGILAELIPSFCKMAFVRAVSGLGIPMILFLDDLQWADTALLELMQALIMDSESTSILFVECYRHNEVTLDSCPFSTHLEDLKATAKVIKIQITNLKKKD